jgi:serine/threonine protein phosphatase PrpC
LILAKEIFCLNEQGNRPNNQDRIYPPKGNAASEENLFIVCDGVGGESKGEVASEIVCRSVYNYINNQKAIVGNEKRIIGQAVDYANQNLAEYASKDSTANRMSTTFSLVLLSEESIIAAWCGDTRIYHLREGRVIWKSDDHSLVHELVKSGELTEEEARAHPKRNIITRSLNALNTNNTVDFHEILNYRDDDFLLLCTDGLLEQINEELMFTILNDQKERNKEALFLFFCKGKTQDNFSMYLIKLANKKSNEKK